jgi:hypothetical protein
MIAQTFRTTAINNPYLTIFSMPDDVNFVQGDWNDEEDEDFDDKMEVEDDMNEIRVGDDINEPNADPDDDDHLPDDDLQ